MPHNLNFLLTALASLSLLGCGSGSSPEATAARSPGGGGTPVTTTQVTTNRLAETFFATGSLTPNQVVNIQADLAGRITALHFREGETVSAGTILVSLDDRELRASLQRIKPRFDFARSRVERQASLRDSNLISQSDFDLSVAEFATIEGEINLLETQIEKSHLRAPFDGRVGLRRTSVGALVNSSHVLTTLTDLSRLYLDFSAPERHAASIEVGVEISFQVAAQGTPHRARIIALEPSVRRDTRMIEIRAEVLDHDPALLPGSFAEVTVPLRVHEAAVIIPTAAVLSNQSGNFVFVIEGNRARQRLVQTGWRGPDTIHVVSGLNPGEEIVVLGSQQIRDGAPVSIVTN
jgi:membrane fusion protein (multidrug efflux system)